MVPPFPGSNPYAPPADWQPAPAGIAPPPPPGKLRIDGAFERAFETTKRIFFRPFSIGKWFVFGFMVWLAELGEGSSLPTNFRIPDLSGTGSKGGHGSAPSADFRSALAWLHDNQATVIAAAVVGGIVIIALSVLVSWLSARGTMMALRAIALDHTRLAEHWHETREAAWAYFGFRMLIAALSLPFGVAILVWGAFAFFGVDGNGEDAFMDYFRALMAPAVVLVAFWLLLVPVHLVGRNLLAPMLLRFGGGLRVNWSRTMGVVRGSFGGVVVFMLMRMLIGFVQSICEALAILVTCCIGILPVIHQMVVAPFIGFERAFTLRVLESLGPKYKLIVDPPALQQPYPPPPYGAGPPMGT